MKQPNGKIGILITTVLSSFDLEDPEDIEKMSEIATAGAPQVILPPMTGSGNPRPSRLLQRYLVEFVHLSDFTKIPQKIFLIQQEEESG